MKRFILTLSLSLGLILVSCNNKQANSELQKHQSTVNKEDTKVKEKREPVKHDTIIDGRKVYNFDKKVVKKESLSLEQIIKDFENGVNSATNCQSLIRACATFDSRIKSLISKDNTIKLSDIESRDDVRKIRSLSEKKSLSLCQTQQM